MFGSDLDSVQLLQALYETLYMVSIALFLGAVIGIPLGVLLVITRKQGIWPNIVIHQVLNPLINILRSLPFIILLIAIVPFTKLVVGTSIGTTAVIVPLTVYVAPYIARLVENSLLEVDEGIIEAAKAMGASPLQIIRYFLIPEALGSLVLAITTAIIGLIGSTAMAGAVGGGGIGDLALVYGYQRFDTTVIIITVIVLVIIVQVIQTLGNVLARFIRRH
ncbi:methionine ABC transporter permease [Staphylococcus aureus]|uniref:methionine ABC transporter permease n=1 Tax=Staphylococcus aureus TaxID=1280 RepID=UPI000D594A36|nr:methionine ABC transporter permease [Staphylococcus aureus]GBS35940.1 binding-protein-dependent transport system inner membrane protein [Staphylococcus aureus]GBS46930.1 binding-protein-dependent transport system inner membrane protein [Staphylococcus aureus]GBS48741.1 binding-protein-dependent transport system inner membrane protein [Staphylococcus aureus]GBT45568.1 binding-protein-dependent transport system inner membrane protein [Staphylococcus aureus]GBT49965.1 binding-protein-dependent